MNLTYKGWKSTRLQLTFGCVIAVTIAFVAVKISSSEWLDFLKWMVGLYAGSEVGAKGAAAINKDAE